MAGPGGLCDGALVSVGYSLHGRPEHRRTSQKLLWDVTARVTWRRLLGRPLVRSWSWTVEVGTELLREQMRVMFSMPVAEARAFGDSLRLPAPELTRVRVSEAAGAPVPARWFEPRESTGRTLLYFHGGGYAYFGRSYDRFLAIVAEATGARVLAPDYRLAPEHPHPAQLEDALATYRWLLGSGVLPSNLAVAGDSAGGHLMLTTLLALRDAREPLPAVGLGLCPWTHSGARGASLTANDPFDWVQGAHAIQFGEWYRAGIAADDPRVSPLVADLRGLPPLVLQAGGREILHDQIVEFAEAARAQGVDVTLHVWPEMMHDFQAFGADCREAREALAALRAAMDARCR